MRPEFGLFVIWSAADHLRPRLLQLIAERFELRGVHRIAWSRDLMAENFGRFYCSTRLTPPFQTYFEHQKGAGPFTLITVVDRHPLFAVRETTKGVRVVNSRMFDLKTEMRRMTAGHMVIHATETAAEATRDLYMLLRITPDRYLRQHPSPWDGVVDSRALDLAGARGWASLRHVFDALNVLVPYVVLRNFEQLPATHVVEDHDDIDLLVDDYHEAIRVLNARPLVGLVPKWGGRFGVQVSGRPITFDVRFVGDGYFDPIWEREVLRQRRLSDAGLFVPRGRDYFETLAYHALVHKRRLSDDYSRRLAEMAAAEGVAGWTQERLKAPDLAQGLLDTLVKGQGRRYVRPLDVMVFYDFAMAGWNWAWPRRKLAGAGRKATKYWWRVKAVALRTVLECRYGAVRRFPVLRRLRRLVSA
jgi:hypothetical protein